MSAETVSNSGPASGSSRAVPGENKPRAGKLDAHHVAVDAYLDAGNVDRRQLTRCRLLLAVILAAGLRLVRGGPGFDPLVVGRRLLLHLGQLRRGAAQLIAQGRHLIFEQARLLLRLAEHRLQLLIVLVERRGARLQFRVALRQRNLLLLQRLAPGFASTGSAQPTTAANGHDPQPAHAATARMAAYLPSRKPEQEVTQATDAIRHDALPRNARKPVGAIAPRCTVRTSIGGPASEGW